MRLFGIAVLTFVIAACGSGGTLPPAATNPPSTEIAATVTPLPPPTETPEPEVPSTPDWAMQKIQRDRLADLLLIEADSVAADARRFEGGVRLALETPIGHYVPLYLTSTCLDGTEPSVEDFRLYTNNSIARRTQVDRASVRLIRMIIGVAESWRNQSLDTATQHCLQPYLYPESVADARPAIDLYLAASLPPLSPLAKGAFEAQVRATAGDWFDRDDQQEPYISWLCGDNC